MTIAHLIRKNCRLHESTVFCHETTLSNYLLEDKTISTSQAIFLSYDGPVKKRDDIEWVNFRCRLAFFNYEYSDRGLHLFFLF